MRQRYMVSSGPGGSTHVGRTTHHENVAWEPPRTKPGRLGIGPTGRGLVA